MKPSKQDVHFLITCVFLEVSNEYTRIRVHLYMLFLLLVITVEGLNVDGWSDDTSLSL